MTLAVVFPGQGSQSVGMLAELAAAFPSVQATFAEASEVLGYDLFREVDKELAEVCARPRLARSPGIVPPWRTSSSGRPCSSRGMRPVLKTSRAA